MGVSKNRVLLSANTRVSLRQTSTALKRSKASLLDTVIPALVKHEERTLTLDLAGLTKN